MKQNMVLTFLTGISLFAVSTLCGQAKTIKSNSTDGPTPKNVLALNVALAVAMAITPVEAVPGMLPGVLPIVLYSVFPDCKEQL